MSFRQVWCSMSAYRVRSGPVGHRAVLVEHEDVTWSVVLLFAQGPLSTAHSKMFRQRRDPRPMCYRSVGDRTRTVDQGPGAHRREDRALPLSEVPFGVQSPTAPASAAGLVSRK